MSGEDGRDFYSNIKDLARDSANLMFQLLKDRVIRFDINRTLEINTFLLNYFLVQNYFPAFDVQDKLANIITEDQDQAKNGKYYNPDKNQIFYLSLKEAIIINNEVKGSKTANPLRVHVCDDETNLDNAIISVMALRMMHFGTTKAPKLPVTISFSDRISGFVRRGIKPPNKSGNIPWWY